MTRRKTPFLVFSLSFFLLGCSLLAGAQTCPKVVYTTAAATTKNMVASVNCLVAKSASTGHSEVNKATLMVESFPVIGPQHTRSYRKIVLAMISVPVGTEMKTALVTAENPSATVGATAGAECKLKLNPDSTVDGQCNQTGGTIFIVYNN